MGVAIPAAGFSAEYYVVPGLKASGNDGSSWEKAITMYDIFENDATAKKDDDASKYKSGDVFYLAGGTYYNATSPGADAGRIYRGYVFVGGCDSSKGAVTQWPTYPSATPTVFSGDLDENGKPSAGDIRNLIHVRRGDIDGTVCKVVGIDFTCSYSPEGSTNYSGAVFCRQGAIEMQYCNVYNNESVGEGSGDGIGAGIHIFGAEYHIKDCNIYNNKANKTGAGFRCTNNGARHCNGVIERCYFGNNELAGKWGAAISQSSGDRMMILNSTIVDNKAYAEGAGISANGATFPDDVRSVIIINSTIAGNVCTANPEDLYAQGETGVTNPGSWLGSQVRFMCDPAVDIYNSIIVGKDDDGTVARAAFMLGGTEKDPASAWLTSGGGNILGTFATVMESPTIKLNWSEDYMDATSPYTYDKVFGNAVAQNNGGFTKTLKPIDGLLDKIGGFARWGFEIVDYVKALSDAGKTVPSWVTIDATVDQTGAKRSQDLDKGDTAPGAFDYFAQHESGIDDVISTTAVLKLQAEGDGLYTISGVEGDAAVKVYNMQGALLKTSGEQVDLSMMGKGVYLLNVNGQTFKVVR